MQPRSCSPFRSSSPKLFPPVDEKLETGENCHKSFGSIKGSLWCHSIVLSGLHYRQEPELCTTGSRQSTRQQRDVATCQTGSQFKSFVYAPCEFMCLIVFLMSFFWKPTFLSSVLFLVHECMKSISVFPQHLPPDTFLRLLASLSYFYILILGREYWLLVSIRSSTAGCNNLTLLRQRWANSHCDSQPLINIKYSQPLMPFKTQPPTLLAGVWLRKHKDINPILLLTSPGEIYHNLSAAEA